LPTAYPKCSPAELTGLLVLLNGHKGSEDVALLADDLDLEIDEILPSLEFAEVLQLIKVHDGRATFTDVGRQLVAGSIRERKSILREQLRKTTLYKALLRALESSPDHQLSEEEVIRLIEFATAPADEFIQNIINWGRYAELFRYDSTAKALLLPARSRPARSSSAGHPPSGGVGADAASSGHAPATSGSHSTGAGPRLHSAAPVAG
jgi:NitT/TauT family transport system ATP-binding protein